ncbi:CvpA family protein [Ekhidna sp. To15]|uniref:CvpA family protein n=1 Tax=Ekhidna sp. To15 TaxID=3395267 RepID=UPI003F51ADAF
MDTFDFIILAVLGIGAIKGYLRGFIVELFSFIAFIIGLLLALELTIPVAENLFAESNYFEVIAVIVFISLFILLSMAIKMGAKAIKKALDMTPFGTLDNVAGAVAGLLKWAFLLSIVLWVFESVGFDLVERYGDKTMLFPYIVDIGPTVFGWLGYVIPFIQDLIDSMENMSQSRESYVSLIAKN